MTASPHGLTETPADLRGAMSTFDPYRHQLRMRYFGAGQLNLSQFEYLFTLLSLTPFDPEGFTRRRHWSALRLFVNSGPWKAGCQLVPLQTIIADSPTVKRRTPNDRVWSSNPSP